MEICIYGKGGITSYNNGKNFIITMKSSIAYAGICKSLCDYYGNVCIGWMMMVVFGAMEFS